MFSAEEKVKWFAISSRVLVFAIQFASNYLVKDHDAKAFKKPLPDSQLRDGHILGLLTEGLTRWDAQYFLHIAEYGYTYENTLAFFPLFPLILRTLAYPFQLVANNAFHAAAVPFFLTTHLTLVLMSVVLNTVLFVHSAILLYRLTFKLTSNEKLAYISALLFAVNPASIFFSAVYSETLFCFLTLNGLLYIENNQLPWGGMIFGLSSLARSNGLVNAGFIVHKIMKTKWKFFSILFSFIVLVVCIALVAAPFSAYQFYCYVKFCRAPVEQLPEFLMRAASRNKYKLVGGSWCNDTIPLAYSYIQRQHWNVGFLNYFEIKQIPNFILAFPVLSYSFYGVIRFFRTHGISLIYLGFTPGPPAILPASCFPYILHLLFMSLFSLLFMHVQVSTRFIFSSCPAIYWICAEIVLNNTHVSKEEAVARKISKREHCFYEPLSNKSSKWKTILLTERFLGWGLIVRYYYSAYFLAGAFIFPNHLPWT